jgi:type IV pilus assembly protein PilM
MAQRFVGIDLGLYEVKVCLVSIGMRRVQVLGSARAIVSPEEREESDELGDAIATAVELLREQGWLQHQAAVTIPSGEASYRTLSFPFADAKRIAQAVSFEVDGQFPVPLEQLAYDHVVIPPPRKGEGGRALVVAARGDAVERVATTFREAGADLRLVTVGAIANAQALADAQIFDPTVVEESDEEEDEAQVSAEHALMMVDLGHQGSELLALTENGPVAARSLRRGSRHVEVALRRQYGLDGDSARQAKEESAFLAHGGLGDLSADQNETAETVHKALAPLLREIEHTRRWLESECGIEVTELRVTGGGSRIAGFDAWLGEQCGLPVRVAAPDVRGLLNEAGSLDWTSMLGAFGAAYGAGRRPLLQLRELDAVGGGISFFEERFGTLFTIGAAMLAFVGLDSVMAIKSAETEVSAYESELAAASEQVFGEPLFSAEAVLASLEGVGGEDLMATVPDRGAMEVLQIIHGAARPGPSPTPVAAPVQGALDPNGAAAVPVDAALPPVPPDSGIVVDDALELSFIEIGPLKIKMLVSASRATAQDRFAQQLSGVACIERVQKGKIREKGDRKQFEMNIDHTCYSGAIEKEEEAEASAATADGDGKAATGESQDGGRKKG